MGVTVVWGGMFAQLPLRFLGPSAELAPLAKLLATVLPQCDTITQAFDLSGFR